MVDKIEFKDLKVEELPATSSVLYGAAHHLGKFCEPEFKTYMQRRFDSKDPRTTLEEGKAVTQCALNFFKKMKQHCNKEFTEHWTCLDYNNQFYGECRKTQVKYDECVLKHFNLKTDQPINVTGPL